MTGLTTKREFFNVVSEQCGHATHLRILGEIDMATAPVLEGCLQEVESNGGTAIVVDLEQVTFMDCSGLRPFLEAAQRASRSGRTFAITRAPAAVRRVLQITGTTHLLAAVAPALPPPDRHSEEPSFAMQATA